MRIFVINQCVTLGNQRIIASPRVIPAVLVAAMALATVDELRGQVSSPPARAPDGGVSVVCVDEEGKAVVGAEVHLFQLGNGSDRRYEHCGPFPSDKQGRAICPKVIFSNEDGNYDRFIYARVSGRLVGVGRSTKWKNHSTHNPEAEIRLRPSRSIEGRVTVPKGFNATKVTVRVQTLHVFTGSGDFEFQSFPRSERFRGLDTALPEVFEATPDADGSIRFTDVPVHGRVYLVTKCVGLGEAQWRNEGESFTDPIELAIDEESLLTGVVLSPDGKPAVGMLIAARLSARGRRRNAYLSTFRAITDEEGKFTIHGLPQTEFVLSVEDPKQRWTFRPREDLLILPENSQPFSLRMEVGVRVSGRVLDPQGRPVESAALGAIADSPGGPGLCSNVTDAAGRYQLHLPTGRARLYFNGLPDGFVYPDPQIVKKLEVKPGQPDIENLNFTLQRQ